MENLPGVVSVKNEIKVESPYAERSDAWIALKIRTRLLVKANVSAAHTKVAVNDGNVTLSGTAENLAQKELTEIYAKEIDQVKSVKNDIVVRERPATAQTVGEKIDDASITSQVKFALLNNKATSALKTRVSTENGVVMITGEASNDAEKSLVSKLAESVRGVTSVKNNMTVREMASM
ncbi:MAG: BON domain-containing protein [Nibricoccus sp.]